MLFWAFLPSLFKILACIGVASQGHLISLCFTFCGINKLFSTMTAPFYIPSSDVQRWQFSHILSNTCNLLGLFVFVCFLLTATTVCFGAREAHSWHLKSTLVYPRRVWSTHGDSLESGPERPGGWSIDFGLRLRWDSNPSLPHSRRVTLGKLQPPWVLISPSEWWPWHHPPGYWGEERIQSSSPASIQLAVSRLSLHSDGYHREGRDGS